MARAKRHYMPRAHYKTLFGAENDDIGLENTYLLDVNKLCRIEWMNLFKIILKMLFGFPNVTGVLCVEPELRRVTEQTGQS